MLNENCNVICLTREDIWCSSVRHESSLVSFWKTCSFCNKKRFLKVRSTKGRKSWPAVSAHLSWLVVVDGVVSFEEQLATECEHHEPSTKYSNVQRSNRSWYFLAHYGQRKKTGRQCNYWITGVEVMFLKKIN